MYSSYTPSSNGISGGKVGSAADFNGTSMSIDVPSSSDFLTNVFTLEGWLYMNQSPSTKGEDETAFAKKHGSSPYRSYGLAESSGSNSTSGNWYDTSGTGAYAGTYSGTTSSGSWHYVVLKRDPTQTGSELSVMTDGSTSGTYTASASGSPFSSTDVLRFGADYDGGARLDGAMDEIRYHSNALSTAQIQTRYKNMNDPWNFWSVGTENSGGGSSTTASTTYTETYSYDLLGNLLSKTGTGNYAYAGNTGTNYANPHAPTTVGSSTLAYDNDGNLTSYASTTYAWDYRNRMTGTASSTYAYDFQNNRVKKVVGSTTTIYPNTLYSITGTSTITRSIYDTGGNLVQTTNGGSATTTAYVHPDILGSTNVTSDSGGHMLEALDYFPYGATHLDLGTINSEPRKYIGQLSDSESGLNYLNARYQDPQRGEFLSEDPVFWGQQNLNDPQSLNSYSYANDNPVTLKDPSGKWWELSYSQVVNNRTFTAGLRIDSNGIDGFFGGGGGIGYEVGAEVAWAPNQYLSHEKGGGISTSAEAADGLGARISQNIVTKPNEDTKRPSIAIVTGEGAGAGATAETNVPLITWGSYDPPSLECYSRYSSDAKYL